MYNTNFIVFLPQRFKVWMYNICERSLPYSPKPKQGFSMCLMRKGWSHIYCISKRSGDSIDVIIPPRSKVQGLEIQGLAIQGLGFRGQQFRCQRFRGQQYMDQGLGVTTYVLPISGLEIQVLMILRYGLGVRNLRVRDLRVSGLGVSDLGLRVQG